GIWYAILSQHATKLAIKKGIEKGIEVGLEKVTEIVSKPLVGQKVFTIPTITELETLIEGKFTDEVTLPGIFKCIYNNINGLVDADRYQLFTTTVKSIAGKPLSGYKDPYYQPAVAAVEKAFAEGKAAEFASHTSLLSNTIIISIVTIIIIVLIMVIIYLVLRYRRKKKMMKKAQYTKLLNQ
ncbi:rifin, partial [Plasmodium reichenowi]